MYNTTSMLRTMELILGLKPMTHFDAGARPMWTAFTAKPESRALSSREAARFLSTKRNPANVGYGAQVRAMDFRRRTDRG